MKKIQHRGSIMLLVIVFSGVFFMILMALAGFVLSGNRAQDVSRERTEAFNIAEAGLNYYRWFLSHFPGNITNGTGTNGPYVSTYDDPESETVGTYSLSIVGNTACDVVQSIDVTSTGVPSDAQNVSTTLFARYARPSIAQYSMIVGASTWFDGTAFQGPMQSNGGLRMDNTTNNAPVTSSLALWPCDSSFGCVPTQDVPGIFGSGLNQDLWKFPTPQMDFTGIATNFTLLKTTAIASGLYFERYSTTANPRRGYHLIFNANGTVTVKKVKTVITLTNVYLLDTLQWGNDYTRISSEQNLDTYTILSDCGVIFVEDNVWIEGIISKKTTVIAANVVTQGVSPNIVIPNNITYTALDGSVGLTAIASHNVLIGPNTPQDLTLNGIFVAQSGAFGRNLYDCDYPAYQYRGRLTMLGTIVSLLRQNNFWVGGCDGGQGEWSGYPDNLWTFVSDRQNTINPPPFTPYTSTQWQFVDWQQK